MKVRLGITAPLLLDDVGQGLWRWPSFVERNFSIHEPLRHSVWIRSSHALSSTCAQFKPGSPQYALQGQLRETELGSPQSIIQAQRNRELDCAWTRDGRAADPVFVRQLLTAKPTLKPPRVVVVMDRSANMAGAVTELAAVLEKLPVDIEWGLVMADDDPVWLREPGVKSSSSALSDRVRRLRIRGGFDNVPALAAGWDATMGKTGALVLWVHGPQPVELSSLESLRQRLERSGGGVHLISLQTAPGPNLLVQKLDGLDNVHAFPRLGSLSEDLLRLFANWSPDGSRWQKVREVTPSPVTQEKAVEATLHLARLWAFDEIGRLQQKRHLSDAVQLAGRYQLVTPVSGAVVLETARQFAEHNLTPADVETVPSIPEPSVVALLLVGLGVLIITRRRQNSSFNQVLRS
jgi:hypothetical protein